MVPRIVLFILALSFFGIAMLMKKLSDWLNKKQHDKSAVYPKKDHDFNKKIEPRQTEISQRPGVAPAKKCPSCGAPVIELAEVCQYCGAAIQQNIQYKYDRTAETKEQEIALKQKEMDHEYRLKQLEKQKKEAEEKRFFLFIGGAVLCLFLLWLLGVE